MAQLAVKDVDDAMDIVQDAMLTLARKYADKPEREWRPLFYRILQNRITDWHRRSTLKNRIFGMFRPFNNDDDPGDPMEQVPGSYATEPEFRFEIELTSEKLEVAVAALPARQQQAFLLRTYEGLDVRDTATAMKCSEGSVKTHYSRAVHTLRSKLEEDS